VSLNYNPENERLKRRYLQYIKEAKRQGQVSVDRIAASIDRFQSHTKIKPFRKFHIEQAIAFKRNLDDAKNARTGKPLSASAKRATLAALKAFFIWLADQPGFRSRISYSDCEYFNLDNRSTALSNARQPKSYPSLEQINHVLKLLPNTTPVEKRDRALVAFAILTGARAAALASAKVSHIDIAQREFYQNAVEVRTKFSKSFQTWFFPVGDLAHEIFDEYFSWLTKEELFGPGDPLFPQTLTGYTSGKGFQITGLKREHWTTTNSIRGIFKSSFKLAGLPYHNPHSFRHTIAELGKSRCTTFEELQSWAQNLGQNNAMTAIQNYGAVSPQRQKEIVRELDGK
jgi:integrase/recombinase XerD